MPNRNDEKPKDLVFLLAIAGRIDAQSRILAQKLDKERHVYYAYAALDSLSSSYSMFKYFFDVFIANNDTDRMHEMMLTPGGIVGIASESIFLVAFSMLACRFDGEKHDAVKKFIATAWPYFRDVIKGLKNAYKGWRSAMQTIGTLSGLDLRHLIVPIGLILGVFAAANRFWVRNMVENRKVMMGDNAALLTKIKLLETLTPEDSEFYLKDIKYQSIESRYTAFAAVSAGGFIDGLYLYVGVLSLTSLSSPVFTAMAILCGIYTLACIITRAYEEYDFQVRLFVTQTKCKLLLVTKELETSYAQLLSMQKAHSDPSDISDQMAQIGRLITQLELNRKLLKEQTSRTYLSAGLLGLKSGLYAYSALASILFLIGTIFVMSSAAFPPVLLIISVSLGMVFMIGFLAHALWANYSHLNKQVDTTERPYDKIIEIKKCIDEQSNDMKLLDANEFKSSIKDGLFLDSSPQFFFQEWFEVIRSFFSGVGKGQKFVDFAGNPLQEMDESGHYHDTPIMYVLAAVSAALFALVLALRALARGLGRPQLGQVDLTANVETTTNLEEQPKLSELPETKTERESAATREPKSDSLHRSKSSYGLNKLKFFSSNNPGVTTKSPLSHSSSNASLTTLSDEPLSTIQGLA